MTKNSDLLVFDGHNDTLLTLGDGESGQSRSFFEWSEQGHLDLPRARDGGFAGGLFAVFAEDEHQVDGDSTAPEGMTSHSLEVGYAQQVTISTMARLFRLETESEGQVQVVCTADQLSACLEHDVLAAVLHFEGAEAIDPQLDALYVFYRAGLRSLGIVWSRPNAFGYGVPFGFPRSPDTGPGLTPAGKTLVRACNELGILVDISHLNEKGFWDVARLSDAPLVATHSGAHALCPSSRNLTDAQLDAIGETGGLVGVNFHVGFLRADGQEDPETPIADIVRHIDHIAGCIGIEHVALGSDFDGATMPRELGDVTGLPKLVAALRAQGYGEADLSKITHQNWLRVLRETWKSGSCFGPAHNNKSPQTRRNEGYRKENPAMATTGVG
jgi:membrane dipeptidase